LGAIQGDRYFELKSPNESVDRRNPALDSEDAGGKNGCKCLLFGTDPEAFILMMGQQFKWTLMITITHQATDGMVGKVPSIA
jgi:hypothetical protein